MWSTGNNSEDLRDLLASVLFWHKWTLRLAPSGTALCQLNASSCCSCCCPASSGSPQLLLANGLLTVWGGEGAERLWGIGSTWCRCRPSPHKEGWSARLSLWVFVYLPSSPVLLCTHTHTRWAWAFPSFEMSGTHSKMFWIQANSHFPCQGKCELAEVIAVSSSSTWMQNAAGEDTRGKRGSKTTCAAHM